MGDPKKVGEEQLTWLKNDLAQVDENAQVGETPTHRS